MEILTLSHHFIKKGFPGGSDGKESVYNAGGLDSVPGLGRFPGEGNGYPPQYSCVDNPVGRGAWLATVHGVPKNWTLLSANIFTLLRITVIYRVLSVCQRHKLSLSNNFEE